MRDYISNPSQALRYADEQKQLSEQIGYTWGVANAYEMKGNVYEYQRKYDIAFKNFENAYRLYGQINDFRVIDVSNNFGVVYSKQGIYTEALRNHDKALKHSD